MKHEAFVYYYYWIFMHQLVDLGSQVAVAVHVVSVSVVSVHFDGQRHGRDQTSLLECLRRPARRRGRQKLGKAQHNGRLPR